MVRRSRRSGLTLLEIVIGIVLFALVGYAVSSVFLQANRGLNKAGRKFESRSSLHQVSGSLQKFLATGDSRFFGFSGRGPGDRSLARVILPRPGACADLSTQGCAEDTALVYTHYDKSLSPAVSAICFLGNSFVVDLKNTTYGTATGSNDGFLVTDPGGTNPAGAIPAIPDSLVALMNPPRVTLWRVTARARQIQANADGTTTPPLPPTCTANLQPLSPAERIGALYLVDIVPLTLTQFTGGSSVTPEEQAQAAGAFPMRLFQSRLRSLGHLPGSAEEDRLGVMECSAPGGIITCGSEINRIPFVGRVRVDEAFKLALGESAEVQRYEILGAGQSPSARCPAPTCLSLPVASPSTIPVTTPLPDGTSESYDRLSPTGFSLIKQEVLSRLKVRVTVSEPGVSRNVAASSTREEEFDVIFP